MCIIDVVMYSQDVVSPPTSPPPRKGAKLPHAFPLEMAFQSSLKSNGSIGEQQNIVGRYMGQLQKYIEVFKIHTSVTCSNITGPASNNNRFHF